jgi:hypothetical protein
VNLGSGEFGVEFVEFEFEFEFEFGLNLNLNLGEFGGWVGEFGEFELDLNCELVG